jgi:ABC-2 type transport system permease protein
MNAWIIAFKDTVVRFRDRGTLFLMLVAPLVLSAIMGLAFGSFFDDDSSPIENIPLLIVNEDSGELGQQLVAQLTAPDLDEVLAATVTADLAAAREAVQSGEAAALLYIPPNLGSGVGSEIQLFTDPVAGVSATIVESIAGQLIADVNSTMIAGQVSVAQAMAQSPGLDPAAVAGSVEAEMAAAPLAAESSSRIQLVSDSGSDQNNNPLAYFAPSLAVFFLFLTMFDNISSILNEEKEGTLARLRTANVPLSQILLGKIGGAFVIGLLQFSFLVIASRLLFRLEWGQSIIGLAVMVVATVAAVTSLGTLLASLARDTNQANIIAGLITLLFAALGGSFFPATGFPDWLQAISRLTLNRWAIEGFADLTIRNLPLNQIVLEAAVLLAIAALFFSLGVWNFPRRLAR